jgi:hypothetical protein
VFHCLDDLEVWRWDVKDAVAVVPLNRSAMSMVLEYSVDQVKSWGSGAMQSILRRKG